jgi:hypothetical protein
MVGVLTVAALVTVAVTVGSAGAGAATENGQILTKVVGSLYSAERLMYGVSTATKPAVYSIAIKNTGDVQTQYHLTLTRQNGTTNWEMFTGSTQITTQDGFFTAPVNPGAMVVVTVKAVQPAGGISGLNNATVDVFVPVIGLYVGTVAMYAYPGVALGGSGGSDLFLKNGSQPWVAGTDFGGEESAVAKPGNTEKFMLRVQNDSGAASSFQPFSFVSGQGPNCPASSFSLTVKMGTQDVTTAFVGNTFSENLAPGAHSTFGISVKYPAAVPGCTNLFMYIASVQQSVQFLAPVVP